MLLCVIYRFKVSANTNVGVSRYLQETEFHWFCQYWRAYAYLVNRSASIIMANPPSDGIPRMPLAWRTAVSSRYSAPASTRPMPGSHQVTATIPDHQPLSQ